MYPAGFEPVCKLGEGAFSSVIYGRRANGSFVALKVYSRHAHVERSARILQEKAVLLRLESPYVLSLLGTDKDPLNLHLYLEPVLGGPLHAHLRRRSGGHLAEETAALYTAEILAALAHMRERSCMHRDLKASNCLLDGAGHIKLSDFSAAKVVDADVAYSYTLIGTPEFMSPEMLLRDVGYTYASDIWSLGVLVYEMLVGRRPFAVPSKQWLSLPSCAIERAAQSSEERDRLQVQFSDLHCHAHLAYVDRVGGDESPPVSAAAWSFLTDSLLVAPDSRRLDSGDLRRARSHPFLRGIDWDALLAGCLPPVDIDRTAGHLHLTDSAEADSDSEVDSRLTAEQQMLFEGF